MNLRFSKRFIKQSKKMPRALRQKIQQRLDMFLNDPFNPILRNHALEGKFKSYRSINITGDYRALYIQNDDEVIFDAVGTHSQLYG